jgi:hypothetical protein
MDRDTARPVRLCGEQIGRPGHICAFFNSREEEYDTLLPYFRDGIEAGDQIVNVLDAERLSDHRERLSAAGLPGDDRIAIASSEDTYLSGGAFDMERMVGFVRDHLAMAAIEGRRIRTAGWMDWIQRNAPGTERVLEYEARMNLLVPDFDCTFLCVYDLAKFDARMLIDILATHPYVILRGRVRKNSFYVPPLVYLKDLIVPGDALPAHS